MSRLTLGLIGLALGLGAAVLLARSDVGRRPAHDARRRLERAAQDFVLTGTRAARRFEAPSMPRLSSFDVDGVVGRLIDRWRD